MPERSMHVLGKKHEPEGTPYLRITAANKEENNVNKGKIQRLRDVFRGDVQLWLTKHAPIDKLEAVFVGSSLAGGISSLFFQDPVSFAITTVSLSGLGVTELHRSRLEKANRISTREFYKQIPQMNEVGSMLGNEDRRKLITLLSSVSPEYNREFLADLASAKNGEHPLGLKIEKITFGNIAPKDAHKLVAVVEASVYLGKFLRLDRRPDLEEAFDSLSKFLLINKLDPEEAASAKTIGMRLKQDVRLLFGVKSGDVFDYLNRSGDRRSALRLLSISRDSVENVLFRELSENMFDRFEREGNGKELGKRNFERMIKVIHTLDAIHDTPDAQNAQLLDTITVMSKTLSPSSLNGFLDKWLEGRHINPLSMQSDKKGVTYKETISIDGWDYEVRFEPKNILLQMESLREVESCLSPGGIYRKHGIDWLFNPNSHFGVLFQEKKIVGRFTVLFGVAQEEGDPVLSRLGFVIIKGIGETYAQEAEKTAEPVAGSVVDGVLKRYAEMNGVRFMKNGSMVIPHPDRDVYDDFIPNNSKLLLMPNQLLIAVNRANKE